MKICQFTSEEMDNRVTLQTGVPIDKFVIDATPGVHATMVLIAALEEINQAGLDGKKLSNIHLVTRPSERWGSAIYEVHADVTHRLKPVLP